MTLAIISHPDCLLHDMGLGHPEQPARIQSIASALQHIQPQSALKYYEAPLATREQLLLAHTAQHVDQIFSFAPRAGLVQIDPDTAMNLHTLQAALRAAGSAVYAVDLVLSGKVDQAFCNVRPPGHHAERARAMGFCFFNNVAIAALYALEKYGLQRVAIVDFDVHHGNGTEDIIKKENRILLCSSFQSPFYPFSGADTLSDHIINLPLPDGTTGEEWREQVERGWLQQLKAFKPELILFSAGFDAYIKDELANFCLEEDDYFWLTEKVLQITEESAQRRVVSVLEGGYDLDGLGSCAVAHLQAML